MKTDIEDRQKELTGYVVFVTTAILFHFLIVSVLTVFSLISINFWIISVLIILSVAVVLQFLSWLNSIMTSFFKLNILNVSSTSYLLINLLLGIVGFVMLRLCENINSPLNVWKVHLSFLELIFFSIPIVSFLYSFHYITIRFKEEKSFFFIKGIGGLLNIYLSWFYCIMFHRFLLKTVPFYKTAFEKTFIFAILKYGYYIWIGIIPILIVLMVLIKGLLKKR